MQFIDLKTQRLRLSDDVDERIKKVLEHGQYVMGPEVAELEHCLCEFTRSRYCITVSSGTDALLIALLAVGIKPGDEVITTPFTFISTAETIALLGAKPVFVDIDPVTYNIDPSRIESALTAKTKAIMPVSLYGQCADFESINAIAEMHRIPVIEDAAQSFGATAHGKKSCALSTIGCTSFFPSKPLGCYGEGGACFTDDEEIADAMRMIRVHGQKRRYEHSVIGLNGRLDSIQAAVLLSKMSIFPEEVAARVSIGARYGMMIGEVGGEIQLPELRPGYSSVFAQYTIQIDQREAVVDALSDRGIPTAVHYPIPLHLQSAFEDLNYRAGSFPIAERAASRVMSLPMHPYLDEETQVAIVQALSDAVGLSRQSSNA